MRLAHACGLPCADVEYKLFEDEPAIIVSRYNRSISQDGSVTRLHQEDLCQALSVMPDQKYTSDGGPGASDVLRLLALTPHYQQNIALFIQMLFFNCLIGAPDAHAKNYSLLLAPGPSALIAPLYDVASGLAYDALRRKGRLAMSIGGENRFGQMSSQALGRFVRNGGIDELGFDRAWCTDAMAMLADRILDSLGKVFDNEAHIPGCDDLRAHLEDPIVNNCKTILAQLGAYALASAPMPMPPEKLGPTGLGARRHRGRQGRQRDARGRFRCHLPGESCPQGCAPCGPRPQMYRQNTR